MAIKEDSQIHGQKNEALSVIYPKEYMNYQN